MAGIINSGSSSNLPDTTGRPYATSFSVQSGSSGPGFHHTGNMQGLHNIHGSFNIPSMQGTLASRNSSMNAIPSNGVQQPAGSLTNGRYTSNNLPISLSQISHGNSLGHSGVTNRGGLGVSQILGNTGPRVTSSMGNIVGSNSGMGRSLSSGGLSVPALASRMNLTSGNGSGSLGVQGPNRLMSGVLQQAPQVISMLGSSYSAAGGTLPQNQLQAGNNQLRSMGILNDVGSNENSPFDINDFPQLTGRPSSAGGPQGQLGSLRKQSLGVVQQNQEFSIQNEDFPALPGLKGGNNDYGMDLHQKEQLHDNAMSMMHSQHFSMGRSPGFSLGGTFSSHRQQNAVSATNQDLLHLHGSDLFPPSHANYHSQVQNSGPPNIGGRPMNSPNSVSGVGSYDQLIQQYQQLQSQSQFRLQQFSAVGQSYRDQNVKSMQAATDRFGLLGLLSVIRMNNPDLTSLALGTDLTTLGLNLSSTNDIHKRFASPWSDEPAKIQPEYTVPECYHAEPPPALHQGYFAKFQPETLFYIFYSMPKDEAQLYAANELYTRGWFYHRELRLWFIRVANMEPLVKTNAYERGSYLCFDPNTWETVRKDNFVLYYDLLEKRPVLPQH
ncbi:PREDICTED: probable NOT transcription complex subunit VIP2 isoform X1 [Nelumbo nucifera]|nr:PREDICTED: probable NOT transcription complex subunit VIP2 isoform X1 [Nelumbo nucifera]